MNKDKIMLTGRLLFILRQFEGNIHKKYNYQNKSCRDLNISSNFPKVAHFSNFLSSHTVISKNIIPSTIDNVKLKISAVLRGRAILGPINALANQPADRLIDNPENAFSQGRNFFLPI